MIKEQFTSLQRSIKKASAEAYVAAQKASGIKVGDTVKVIKAYPDNAFGWINAWTGEMNKLIGKTAVVKSISDSGISLDCGSYTKGFPFFALELVGVYAETKVKDYDCTILNDSIKVGCQTIPWTKIEEIVKLHGNLTKR